MTFPQRYEQAIIWIVSLCPAPDKFAHTYAGLLLWLIAALVMRKPLRSPWPLLVVFVLEGANEGMDRISHGSWQWHDTLRDMAATWFWPVVLTAALRWIPFLTQSRRDTTQI
ncbi:hypothetical protein KY084_02165 [Stakelama sp. CBK3Z-3]|uniref:VanZ-like domain-containing protein n=1 Tax=Stakelama flava TaxID=2860338 RepID=A0ABS6XHJ1_9SPHN|nr:hypothetical protein [Stakelama flava]MBW4329679.1 hypothetical protein [Stakelama flava]